MTPAQPDMLETIRSFFEPPISADDSQSTAKLAWIVRLRWIAIGAQLLSIVPALEFRVLEVAMLAPFLTVIALLATLNGVTWAGLRRGASATQTHILVQLVADIAALSCLLALTGGAWNPLVPILFVHTGLGALLLDGRLSVYFFTSLIGCLLVLQAGSHIPPGLAGTLMPAKILFPAQILVALVFWILTAWLSRTLGSMQNHFAFLRERKTRIDRLRAVGALAAGLSHEFATPLNTAQLKLSRLARKHDLDDNEDLSTAADALDRCRDVLRRMAGAPLYPESLDLQVADVDDLVDRLCSSVSQVHDSAPIEFRAEGRAPRRALLPSVAFSQAVLNLIDNALESAGTVEPVRVVVGRDAGRVEVSVHDRGAGWPEVVKAHLGQPFVTTKANGVGLGLYYVHTLAQAIGAELTLEDPAEGGAIARISLPAAQSAAEPSR